MKSKNSVLIICLLFLFLAFYYLPFTFMDIQVQKRADNLSRDEEGKVDVKKKQEYLDSLWNKEAYRIFGFKFTYEEIKKKSLALGLDLQGGMSFVIDIDMDELLIQLAAKKYKKKLKKILNEIDIKTKNNITLFIKEIEKRIGQLNKEDDLVSYFNGIRNGIIVGETKLEKAREIIKEKLEYSLSKTLDVVKNRINKYGTFQPNIYKLKDSREIQIEIPGTHNPNRIKELLRGVAKLQFWLEYDKKKKEVLIENINKIIEKNKITGPHGREIKLKDEMVYDEITAREIMKLLQRNDMVDLLPDDMSFFCEELKGEGNRKKVKIYFLACDKDGNAALNGDVITDARPSKDMSGKVVVEIQMNSQGTKLWRDITGNNIGKKVIATLDNKVIISANISDKIPNGHTSLSGNYTQEEAKDLALMLKSGSLPTPVTIIEETIIGPGLGSTAKSKGIKSVLIALILIMLLMFLLYSKSSFIINLALLLNFLFILTGFAIINSVLTLTGIVGLVLTLSMAIDANVLINERIKEEISIGKGIREAVANGYAKASSSILDSNVTTLLSSIVLFVFGSGSIRGFSTTLIIGLISSFFTAVFVSRYFFYLKEQNKTLKNMSFSWGITKNIFNGTNSDFIKRRHILYIFSLFIFILGAVCIYKKGFSYGLDFTGGYNYIVKINSNIDPAELKSKLCDKIKTNVEVKTFGSENVFKISIPTLENDIEKENHLKKMNDVLEQIFKKGDVVNKKEAVGKTVQESGKMENVSENSSEKGKEEKGINKVKTIQSMKKGKKFEIVSSERIDSGMVEGIRRNAKQAILLILLIIFLYIFFRFKRWEYGLAAIISLLHDIFGVVTLCGIANFCGFNIELNFMFIAAILTILGYSINNTVIIFDRIREEIKTLSLQSGENVSLSTEIINDSINKTLSRTIITSLSTIIAVVIIFLCGGVAINKFSFVLLLGFSFGLYSSIFISAPILKDLKRKAS